MKRTFEELQAELLHQQVLAEREMVALVQSQKELRQKLEKLRDKEAVRQALYPKGTRLASPFGDVCYVDGIKGMVLHGKLRVQYLLRAHIIRSQYGEPSCGLVGDQYITEHFTPTPEGCQHPEFPTKGLLANILRKKEGSLIRVDSVWVRGGRQKHDAAGDGHPLAMVYHQGKTMTIQVAMKGLLVDYDRYAPLVAAKGAEIVEALAAAGYRADIEEKVQSRDSFHPLHNRAEIFIVIEAQIPRPTE